MSDRLAVADIRARLTAPVVGRRLYLLGEVDSTHVVAGRLAREGAPEGTVVMAEAQTASRSRQGRVWFSPPGVNLYASVLLRPAIHAREAWGVALSGALALADTIEDLGPPPAIRWPDAVLVDGKTVAGLGVELTTRGEEIMHVILSAAVNVNLDRAALRAGLGPSSDHATSLGEVLGRPVPRNTLAAAYLGRLDAWTRRHRDDGVAPLVAAWRCREVAVGLPIEGARGLKLLAVGATR